MFVNTARKYSPKSLSEFVYPNDSVRQLIEAYASGQIDQPLILHGKNGTGKSLLQQLLPDAIEGFTASPQIVKCADLKTPSDIHDLYGRNKQFNKNFTVNGQRYNYIIIEEFLMTNRRMNDALKIELDKTMGTDLTILSTNHFSKIDQGIISRSLELEMHACEPKVFLPHAMQMFEREGVQIDELKLLKCLEVVYAVNQDVRKYYQSIDALFRTSY